MSTARRALGPDLALESGQGRTKTNTRGCRSRPLAREMSWRWPSEKFAPASSTSASSAPGIPRTTPDRRTWAETCTEQSKVPARIRSSRVACISVQRRTRWQRPLGGGMGQRQKLKASSRRALESASQHAASLDLPVLSRFHRRAPLNSTGS